MEGGEWESEDSHLGLGICSDGAAPATFSHARGWNCLALQGVFLYIKSECEE